MSVAFADYDQDGHLDAFVTNDTVRGIGRISALKSLMSPYAAHRVLRSARIGRAGINFPASHRR